MQAFIQPGNNYAREDLNTNGATPVRLSKSVYRQVVSGPTNPETKSPRFAILTIEVNPIRYTRDGATTPVEGAATTSVGAVHGPTTTYPLVLTNEGQIERFQFVAVTAGAARVHVEYFQ